MGTCLVTKLKAAVADKSLTKINGMTIFIPASIAAARKSLAFQSRMDAGMSRVSVYTSDSRQLYNSANVDTRSPYVLPYLISDALTGFYMDGVNSSFYLYLDSIQQLSKFDYSGGGDFVFDINELKYVRTLIQLSFNGVLKKNVDLATFTNLSEATSITLRIDGAECSDLSKLVTVGGMNVGNNAWLNIYNTKGSIESLVSALRSKGYASGNWTQRFFGPESNTTYNGVRIVPSTSSQDEVTYHFSYDADGIYCPELD